MTIRKAASSPRRGPTIAGDGYIGTRLHIKWFGIGYDQPGTRVSYSLPGTRVSYSLPGTRVSYS